MKKVTLIKLLCFVLIFSFLAIIATLYDYQISNFLVGKNLKNGYYYSNNLLGNIIEIVGESILYIFLTFSFIILAFYFYNTNSHFKIITIIFTFIAFYFSYRMFSVSGKYIYEIYNLDIFNSIAFKILYVLFAILYTFLNMLLVKKKFLNKINELVPFVTIVIVTFALSTIITHLIIKPFMGRERFRATYYLVENNLEHLGFTKWYVFNGSSSKLASIYNVDKELYKSFPSGHTCAAAISFTLLLVPKMFNVSTKSKWFYYIFPFVYTFLVAFGRIIVGAHYLSDVLFGGTITFVCTYISYFGYLFIKKKVIKKK